MNLDIRETSLNEEEYSIMGTEDRLANSTLVKQYDAKEYWADISGRKEKIFCEMENRLTKYSALTQECEYMEEIGTLPFDISKTPYVLRIAFYVDYVRGFVKGRLGIEDEYSMMDDVIDLHQSGEETHEFMDEIIAERDVYREDVQTVNRFTLLIILVLMLGFSMPANAGIFDHTWDAIKSVTKISTNEYRVWTNTANADAHYIKRAGEYADEGFGVLSKGKWLTHTHMLVTNILAHPVRGIWHYSRTRSRWTCHTKKTLIVFTKNFKVISAYPSLGLGRGSIRKHAYKPTNALTVSSMIQYSTAILEDGLIVNLGIWL